MIPFQGKNMEMRYKYTISRVSSRLNSDKSKLSESSSVSQALKYLGGI